MRKLTPPQPTDLTIVVTILNEAESIQLLLESLQRQTRQAKAVIISDAGSTDGTLTILANFAKANPTFPLRLLHQPGNRSVGRNVAIQRAATELIAITDAGCIPAADWLEKLVEMYRRESSEHPTSTKDGMVIAGYYQALPRTPFEAAVVPYVLVMPDRVNPKTFLPATRSVLLEKKVWQKIGKFDERFRWNEDYEFAQRLRSHHIPIFFAAKAIVSWLPRENLRQFWSMIWHFAQGDVEAGIWRTKVLLIFIRYLLLFIMIWVSLWARKFLGLTILLSVGSISYVGWAITKNQKYVARGKYWLPILQVTADFAVMAGSLFGLINQQKTLE